MKLAIAMMLLVSSVAVAVADDESDVNFGLGVRAPSMMHVGAWRAMDLGVMGLAGVREGRFALFTEGDLVGLYPASWSHGAIDGAEGPIEGSEQRIAIGGRLSVLQARGAWSWRNGLGQQASHDFYVDGQLGIERLSIAGETAMMRRDLEVGVGWLWTVRVAGATRSHLASFYALHLIVADGVATPGPTVESLSTMPRGRDVGVGFELGLLWGP